MKHAWVYFPLITQRDKQKWESSCVLTAAGRLQSIYWDKKLQSSPLGCRQVWCCIRDKHPRDFGQGEKTNLDLKLTNITELYGALNVNVQLLNDSDALSRVRRVHSDVCVVNGPSLLFGKDVTDMLLFISDVKQQSFMSDFHTIFG